LTGYKQVEELRTAALLHDIGKIVLSDIVGEVAGEEELQTLHIGVARRSMSSGACAGWTTRSSLG